jgi:hypothetical protein
MAENSRPDLVRRIRAVPELKAIFTNLWGEDDVYRRFFFAHRDLLFARIEEGDLHATIPLLFFGTEPSEPEEQVLVTAGESRTAQLDVLGEPTEKKVDEISQDAKTAAYLLVLRFVARNPALKALLDQGEPSWAAVAKAIATTPLMLDIFEEFKPGPASPGADKVFYEKSRRYAAWIKDVVRKGDVVKYASAVDLSNNLIPIYGPCRAHLADLLDARDLEVDEHRGILQGLYLQRMITNVGTTFWCARCQDDVTMLTSRSRIAPEQLVLPCPKCTTTMHVATLYEPNALIHEACFSTDGMLGVAIGWLLSTRGITFQSGSYARDQELDFRFEVGGQRILLEAKMHKTGKDDEAVQRHLSGDVSQAARHAEEIKKCGGGLDEVWIVTNYLHDDIERELNHVHSRNRDKMSTHRIEFVEAADLPRQITEAATPSAGRRIRSR